MQDAAFVAPEHLAGAVKIVELDIDDRRVLDIIIRLGVASNLDVHYIPPGFQGQRINTATDGSFAGTQCHAAKLQAAVQPQNAIPFVRIEHEPQAGVLDRLLHVELEFERCLAAETTRFLFPAGEPS